MGIWKIGVDVLARARFVVSPLVETVAALTVLDGAEPGPALREWATANRPRYRARLAADPRAAALVAAALRPGWLAYVFAVPPSRGDRTFADELRRIRELPVADALRDLDPTLRRSLPFDDGDVATVAADLLDWVWSNTVEPDWPRRRRILEADIVSRTRRLAGGGWSAATDDLGPGMRWLGNGELRVNRREYPPRLIADAELLFIPSSARRGWLGWDEPRRYAIVYPARGLLAPEPNAVPFPLRRLIGPRRAELVGLLAEPRTPSQLNALTGYGLGSIGGHLRVLHDAGLVARRRSGRQVVYLRTELGTRLVQADGLEP